MVANNHNNSYLDITGRKFGRLTAIEACSRTKNGVKWKCICDCGNWKEVNKGKLCSGHTKSCGCLQKDLSYQRLRIDLTGQKFGRLVVLKEIPRINNKGLIKWLCECDCGNLIEVRGATLRNGRTKSCGCLMRDMTTERNITHNMPLYSVWSGMIERCTNPKCLSYKRYGEIGINVCDRWLGNQGIHNFVEDVGERPEGTSLDRIDNTQGYYPENCRWAIPKQQSNNRKDNIFIGYQGESKTISQWADDSNILYSTFYTRLSRGWKIEEVIQGFRNISI